MKHDLKIIETIGQQLKTVGCTNVGCVRTLNEDTFYIDPSARLLVVSDGMGGHEGGEVASSAVVSIICGYLRRQTANHDFSTSSHSAEDAETEEVDGDSTLDDFVDPALDVVRSAVQYANRQIHALNKKKGYRDGSGMGATVVGIWMPPGRSDAIVFHVGDSRLYLFRRGNFQQITQDHSFYQQWENNGRVGKAPAKNILIRAIGPHAKISPDVGFCHLEKDDVLLLCSDGLTGMVPDQTIQTVLRSISQRSIEPTCDKLVHLARKQGGTDNITVILGYVLAALL